MDLRKALDTFYYSTALCDLRLMNKQFIDRKYHIIRGFVESGNVTVCKIASEDNLADPFTKTLVARRFEEHVEGMGMRNMSHLLA